MLAYRPGAIRADKRHPKGAPAVVEETFKPQNLLKECPECGARERLYRTPRGLRCAECVKRLDSAGLGFR